uniref:Uncharacterized protein n=1 Tax=Mycena chlorophos TaxID=658473 RepID=A0ABQ0MCS9_MYCCL|nr:predicted protein [Mycena chlorophos]
MTDSDEPRLPQDLEQLVFEGTAVAFPQTITSLVLVAHRVHVWMQPILFHTLRLTKKNIPRFIDLTNSKSPEFLARNIRTIVSPLELIEIERYYAALAKCTGVRSLAMGTQNVESHSFLQILAGLALQRLAIALYSLKSARATGISDYPVGNEPAFRNLTHVEVFDEPPRAQLIPFLKMLPRLTHLALNSLNFVPDEFFLREILERGAGGCEHLRLLVILVDSQDDLDRLWIKPIFDDRIVATQSPDWAECVEDGYWLAAENLLAAKRSGHAPDRKLRPVEVDPEGAGAAPEELQYPVDAFDGEREVAGEKKRAAHAGDGDGGALLLTLEPSDVVAIREAVAQLDSSGKEERLSLDRSTEGNERRMAYMEFKRRFGGAGTGDAITAVSSAETRAGAKSIVKDWLVGRKRRKK